MTQPPSNYDLDLDILTGGEIRVKLHGRIQHFYAVFSNRDVAHYRRIQSREQQEYQRQLAYSQAIADYKSAYDAAARAGLPPPSVPDLDALGTRHKDYYDPEEHELDIHNLLLSVWQASEHSKPAHEQEPVTEKTVDDLTYDQMRQLLVRLWLRRNDPRVSPPATPEAEPANPETEAVTSTASTTAAPKKPRPKSPSKNSGS